MLQVQHIHPMLVHFPIVLILLLAVFDLVATLRGVSVTGRTTVGTISTLLVVTIAVFAALTFHFGDVALSFAEDRGFSSEIAEIHEGLGEWVAMASIVYALLRMGLWWRDLRVENGLRMVFPLAAIAASGLVLMTAYYGGQLVYDLGVNVASLATTAATN
ncbi:MAG: DUF2231 domain-containing protein [Paracoccaceae bacterium]|nr:DUF2231 domain-containing protein [Paracoccaceae bacterium]